MYKKKNVTKLIWKFDLESERADDLSLVNIFYLCIYIYIY